MMNIFEIFYNQNWIDKFETTRMNLNSNVNANGNRNGNRSRNATQCIGARINDVEMQKERKNENSSGNTKNDNKIALDFGNWSNCDQNKVCNCLSNGAIGDRYDIETQQYIDSYIKMVYTKVFGHLNRKDGKYIGHYVKYLTRHNNNINYTNTIHNDEQIQKHWKNKCK